MHHARYKKQNKKNLERNRTIIESFLGSTTETCLIEFISLA